VYWRGPDEGFGEECCIHRRTRPARHWQVLRLGLRGHPQWRGTVAGMRLDLFNCAGPAAEPGLLRWVRLVEQLADPKRSPARRHTGAPAPRRVFACSLPRAC
jgi:hypothetical protein